MIENSIQLGDPVEHRGVVIAPLFPRNDPTAEYLTLEEALPLGFRITEIDAAGLKQRDTADCETPARRATSYDVALPKRADVPSDFRAFLAIVSSIRHRTIRKPVR